MAIRLNKTSVSEAAHETGPHTSVVFGGSGGLGGALTSALLARGGRVHAFSRSQAIPPPSGALTGSIDITKEASVAAAADQVQGEIDLVIVATGRLSGEGMSPERSFTALDPQALARSFEVNTIGPALLAKHFLPRLAKRRPATFAALSARVGSIEDNRLGGWYGYRASKAALNMLVRSLAVELARTRPLAICVALHPGTVDTALSRPFQRNVAAGKLFTPHESAERMLAVLDGLGPCDSGGFYAYDGTRIPF
ncbi:SDR family NAD(P)-dependent oxidoreductase [Caulobacter sp. S45]|uniref:SDR family NAD(P)-dependent oxidoreductase n=1 Tax=Caulobacter sp. S45 TaxID=1641861 RepID=UPI0020C70C4A|nr:SDR family NAD(P)-dependent oxidoreductase [Caulobacter sp. S45]